MHCLLVEAAFLTVHAGDGCDNLSKLHDFTLHRLLVEIKFLGGSFTDLKIFKLSVILFKTDKNHPFSIDNLMCILYSKCSLSTKKILHQI